MKEKSKKILSSLTIITILCSLVLTLFSKNVQAATSLTDTTINVADWLAIYAQSGASLADPKEWAKENGFDISTIKNQEKYVLNFEKATKTYNVFNDGVMGLSDSTALLSWYALLTSTINKDGTGSISESNDLIASFKQMGINIQNLKLTATVVADGKTYEMDSEKREYTTEQLAEIFKGDIIEDGTTITFSNDDVKPTVNGDSGELATSIATIKIENNTATILDKDGNEIKDAEGNLVTDIKSLYFPEVPEDAIIKTKDIQITKDGKTLDLFSNSSVKENIVSLYLDPTINKWILDYRYTGIMDVDKANFKVIDGNGDTWHLVLGTDVNCYLVNDNAFNDSFDTTLSYNAKIDEKEVGGITENGVYKPNYDKDNIKKDADVTATIKSTNGDNIITVDGKELDSTGKANEDGWYYPDVNDKTTIAKLYPFSKYDNSTDNGMVTQKVELGNEDGLTSNQTVSIKWPFRIIDRTYDSEEITKDTEKVTVTITTNLPMDPDKIPDGWTIVPDTDNHKITKTYTKGEDVTEDVTVYQNKTGDTDKTDVTIKWVEEKPSALPDTGESIIILSGIALLIGITVFLKKKSKK